MEVYLHGLFHKAVINIFKNVYQIAEFSPSILIKDLDISASHCADFQYKGIIRVFQKLKQLLKITPTLCKVASDIIDFVLDVDRINNINKSYVVIDKMILSENHINIVLNNTFIHNTVIKYGVHLMKNGPIPYNLFGHPILKTSERKIIVDYSSPNIAKSLHIGHLRSTIIGEIIVRLLKNAGHNVVGLNHIGDWGTQFGMIINFLKQKYNNSHDLDKFLDSADSEILMNVYRDAKNMFDTKESLGFANDSREQTYMLQQNNINNVKIWKKICDISSSEYSKIYDMLNIRNLVERGESFYQKFIPEVMKLLDDANILVIESGVTKIMFDNWTYPLIVIKSCGGYTYDTTDIVALYHRLHILDSDEVIYVTDVGQKSHFIMCFEVATFMGWTKNKSIRHIGFGLVCGKDGKKLKTRSGEVVKMLDCINEVVQRSESIIRDRIVRYRLKTDDVKIPCVKTTDVKTTDVKTTDVKTTDVKTTDVKTTDVKTNDVIGDSNAIISSTDYYLNITEDEIKNMSRKIGINTLKYFDICHNYETNYKYDPELMFRFNGDTGVYLMYCIARINGIVDKSGVIREYCIDRKNYMSSNRLFEDMTASYINPIYFTKETRDLMIHIISFSQCLCTATNELNSTKLTTYVFSLCTLFNSFITQKGGKIIGSENEKFNIMLCLIVLQIIQSVFDLLSFEHIDYI